MIKKVKGALAIEAVIGFTVFICFMFLLLAVVKLSMVYITINDVTAETTKRIAGMSYPVQFINDLYDKKVDKIEDTLKVDNIMLKAASSTSSTPLSIVDYLKLNIGSKVLSETGISDFLNSASENLVNNIFDGIEDLVLNKQQELVESIFINLIEDTEMPINTDNIKIVFFTLPLSQTTYDNHKDDIAEKTGFSEDELDRNDVILIVEYDYTISVPFFPSYDITLRSSSVEKGWLNGGNHTVPSKREGVDISDLLGKTVYYTDSGKGEKYHKVDCITLKRSGQNRKETTLSAARSAGLEPCKVCTPDVGS